MLTRYNGLYENLTPTQRQAIHRLTVCRYVEDIYHLSAHLQQVEGLTPGTPAFEQAFATKHTQIDGALAGYDKRTYVSAILMPDRDHGWIALASMRVLHGQRTHVVVADSIGHAASSIPTHRLLQSFEYPQLPDFDPNEVSESQISEVSRLVTADCALVEQVVHSGMIGQTELRAVLMSAFDELLVNFYRAGTPAVQVVGWIFNIKPRLARALKSKKRLNLVPLFSQGAEPTKLALTSSPDKLYFERWHGELYKLIPDSIGRDGTLAAVRYLASRDVSEWSNCEISLPYMLLHDDAFKCAIDRLETNLARRMM